MIRVAVDIGGTFTDVLLYDEKKKALSSLKISSSPAFPEKAFLEGLKKTTTAEEVSVSQIHILIHGTTLVTNALLERKTARTGLLVTQGFRDLLEIGRQVRPELYDLKQDRISPLVHRNDVGEIPERTGPEGEVVKPLDEEKARKQIRRLARNGIESLAVVLFFSFLNPAHEAQISELAEQYFPKTSIFPSYKVSPEFREFERASTTVVAAAVAPRVVSYLETIQESLESLGSKKGNLLIMHSGGGTLPPQEVAQWPHTIVESGPAAGILAAGRLSKVLEDKRLIAFDMGGTTAKAGLILDGKPQYTAEYEVGGSMHRGKAEKGKGYPVRFPMIDVAECGAGAGSIAWVDAGGHLQVGPQSAGADPGPACYGKGGIQPTVTDAYLFLGYLDADSLLGGEMTLHFDLAEQVISDGLCKQLDMNPIEAAQGILAIADANMLRILRLVSLSRGFDPRDFSLVAYGGAGPLHACALAQEMSMRKVIIPPHPGLFSALGLLVSDVTADFVETVMLMWDRQNLKRMNEALSSLRDRAKDWFQRVEAPRKDRSLQFSADLRYLGQNFELNVPVPSVPLYLRDLVAVAEDFHQAHKASYGHSAPGEPIQAVNFRLRAVRTLEKPDWTSLESAVDSADGALKGTRQIVLTQKASGGKSPRQQECKVYERSRLRAGHLLEGPSLIQEKNSTTFVGPSWRAKVHRFGNLVITRLS